MICQQALGEGNSTACVLGFFLLVCRGKPEAQAHMDIGGVSFYIPHGGGGCFLYDRLALLWIRTCAVALWACGMLSFTAGDEASSYVPDILLLCMHTQTDRIFFCCRENGLVHAKKELRAEICAMLGIEMSERERA